MVRVSEEAGRTGKGFCKIGWVWSQFLHKQSELLRKHSQRFCRSGLERSDFLCYWEVRV